MIRTSVGIYAGIGSRQTPVPVLLHMTSIAKERALLGWTLRSGGARGADGAFEVGCALSNGRMEIYYAHHATVQAIEMASRYHPNWGACSSYARKLHGRNCMILLGKNLDTPVDECLYWTEGGQVRGGTGQALRMCKALGIPITWIKE